MMKQRGSEIQHQKNLNLMEVMTACYIKKRQMCKNMPNCIIEAVQFFTAMAVCISEWRERGSDGLQLCVR